MKTAEEWLTDPKNKERSTEQDVIDWIKEIQLDAMKDGMRRAANLLQKELNSCHGPHEENDKACMPCTARNNSKIDILAAADN